jgi:hypothetical protein
MTLEETPYYQAARYLNKAAAGKAYTPVEQIIHDEECDLSAYRFFVPSERKWYVVVIGEQPIVFAQDSGISGTTCIAKRIGLTALVTAIEQGTIKAVIASEETRLFRWCCK